MHFPLSPAAWPKCLSHSPALSRFQSYLKDAVSSGSGDTALTISGINHLSRAQGTAGNVPTLLVWSLITRGALSPRSPAQGAAAVLGVSGRAFWSSGSCPSSGTWLGAPLPYTHIPAGWVYFSCLVSAQQPAKWNANP